MTSDVFFWTYLPTQPDLTLFYLIFTYLGLFEFLEDMAQMWHYINFLAVTHRPRISGLRKISDLVFVNAP